MTTSRSPTLAELITQAIQHHQESLHVMLPGQIMVYDPTTQKADVQPLLMRKVVFEDGTEPLAPEPLPVLPNVPVLFPRGGGTPGFFVSFPLVPGDLVMIAFAERSLDRYLSGAGAITDPDDFRMHDLSDAVAIPGMYPFARALADASPVNMALGASGGPQVHFDKVNVHLGGFPAVDFLAKATPTEARIAALETAFNAHVHPTGVGPSGPPTPLVTPGAPVTTTIAKGT